MTSSLRSLVARSSSFVLLAISAAGCAGTSEPEPWEAPPGYTHMGDFVAHLDPKARTITLERLPAKSAADEGPGLGPQSLDEVTITQDNVEGSGPANTIELVGNGAPSTNAGCPVGFQNKTFCANITMRSFYAGRSLNNVYLQATKIEDSTHVDTLLHSGVNSDPSFGALSNTLGLWKFTGSGAPTGVLGPSSASPTNAGAHDIIFANPDDSASSIYLHAYTTLTYSGYTQTATDSSAFLDASSIAGGVQVLKNGDGITPKTTTLPFAFTFYGTTFAASSTVTLNRYGGLGFGSQLTANTGANIALPSAAATTFHPGIFPFWDDINFTGPAASSSGVWAATSGSAPFRKFVVTWKTMKFTGDTNGNDNLTFSAVLSEGSDRIDFAYQAMTATLPAVTGQQRANGNSATIGVQNSAGTVTTHLFNTGVTGPAGKGYADTTLP